MTPSTFGIVLHHLRVTEVVGYLTRRRRRAVDRCQDGDVIPGADASILAPETHEGPALILGNIVDGAILGARRIVELEPLADRQLWLWT
jgi:hypothetical protein